MLSVSDTALYINNKKNDITIWHFMVERERVVSLLSCVAKSPEESAIQPGKTQNISLKDVYGYEKGDEIIFYYWSVKEPEFGDIKGNVIKTD